MNKASEAHEAGPATNRTGQEIVRNDDTIMTRCRTCGHPLTAETSVRLELGPVCGGRR